MDIANWVEEKRSQRDTISRSFPSRKRLKRPLHSFYSLLASTSFFFFFGVGWRE